MTLCKRKKKFTVAMIPARMGSRRLAMKNLALLDGRPLIYYAIKAAEGSGIFDRVVVNSEDAIFEKIAGRYNAEFYRRPSRWATSGARSDFVVYDFVKQNPCDIVAWVNPTSPLQAPEKIRDAADYFIKNKLDSLITVKNEQVHCLYKGKPVNFRMKDVFAKTQELTPVQPFVYSLMMWRTDVFMRAFEKKGHALFCGKTGFYPADKLSTVIIKRKEDLMLAEYILRQTKRHKEYRVDYDKAVNNLKNE